MFNAPISAPQGAAFLITAPARRIAGTLIADTTSTKRVERILEISPNSAKLCAMAAIQDHAVSSSKVNARLLGDKDALSDEDLAFEFGKIARTCVDLIMANVPTEYPLYQAAAALRACGCIKVRWDDVSNTGVSQFEAEVRRVVLSNPQDALASLHAYGRDILLSTSGAYESRPLRVKASKNPEKANELARVASIRAKFRSRAREYEQRIRAIKDGVTTIGRDHRDPQRKVVYLVAARTFMQCAEFSEGPKLDLDRTMELVLSRINHKIESVGDKPRIQDHHELFKWGKLSRSMVEEANARPKAKGWFPDEYARGIMAAERWAAQDCEFEKGLVYFTPRSVDVKVRVKKHILSVERKVSEPAPEVKSAGSALASMFGKKKPAPTVEAEEEVAQVGESATPKKIGDFQLSGLKSLFKKTRRAQEDYVPFVDNLEIWQMILLHQHAGEEYPIEGTKDDQLRLALQATQVSRSDLSDIAVDALVESTVLVMARHQMAMVAPVREDMEVGEDLIQ
jgi:hypothetical protein